MSEFTDNLEDALASDQKLYPTKWPKGCHHCKHGKKRCDCPGPLPPAPLEQEAGPWPLDAGVPTDGTWADYRAEHKAKDMDDAMPTIPAKAMRKNTAVLREAMAQMELFPMHDPAPMDPADRLAQSVIENIASAADRGVDMVNLPQHYARFKIEPIRFLVENYGPSILVGKVVKYSMRYDAKNGMEDLKKARRCLDMLMEHLKGNPDWWMAGKP